MIKKLCLVLLVVALVGSGFTLNAQEASKKAQKLVQKGNKALEAKNLDKALEAFNEAVGLETEYAAAHLGLAKTLMMQDKKMDGLKHVNTAVSAKIKDAEVTKELASVLFNLAVGFSQQNKPKEANMFFEQLVNNEEIKAARPDLATTSLYQLGFNFFRLNQTQQSVESLEKFLQTPDVATQSANFYLVANYLQGVNYAKLKESEKSNTLLNVFLDLTKDNPEHQWIPMAHFFIGSNFYDMLDKERSQYKDDQIEEVAKLARSKTGILSHLEKAKNSQAAEVIREQAAMKIGNYYYLCRELDKAIAEYQGLIDTFPASPDLEKYKEFLKTLEEAKTSKEKQKK